jgi:hypothetical protein
MEIDAIVEAFLEKAREQNEIMSHSKSDDHLTEQYKNALVRYRSDLEVYVYQYLMTKYGPTFDAFWKTHSFPIKSPYAWVIVERRCHPNWWFVLRNLAWAAPSMSLYLFCSDENLPFLKTLLGDKANTVHLIPWFKGYADRPMAIKDYNEALKTAGLYEKIDAEYAIFAQLDTYVRYKIPASLFMGDYYGAPWNWDLDAPGGGGLSVRKIKSMIRICKEAPKDDRAEDIWFSDYVRANGYSYPPLELRTCIFSESYPIPYFIGVHQFWTYLDTYSVYNKAQYREILKNYLTIHIDDK